MLNFEIGQRESGFYSGRTESQTDKATQYRISIWIVYTIYTLLDLAPPKQNFWLRQWKYHVGGFNDNMIMAQ